MATDQCWMQRSFRWLMNETCTVEHVACFHARDHLMLVIRITWFRLAGRIGWHSGDGESAARGSSGLKLRVMRGRWWWCCCGCCCREEGGICFSAVASSSRWRRRMRNHCSCSCWPSRLMPGGSGGSGDGGRRIAAVFDSFAASSSGTSCDCSCAGGIHPSPRVVSCQVAGELVTKRQRCSRHSTFLMVVVVGRRVVMVRMSVASSSSSVGVVVLMVVVVMVLPTGGCVMSLECDSGRSCVHVIDASYSYRGGSNRLTAVIVARLNGRTGSGLLLLLLLLLLRWWWWVRWCHRWICRKLLAVATRWWSCGGRCCCCDGESWSLKA